MKSIGQLRLAAAASLALLCTNVPVRGEPITEPVAAYSTYFEFDAVSGYRQTIDFGYQGADVGPYARSDGLVFYSSTSAAPGSAGQFANVLLARSNRGEAIGFMNGIAQFTFDNAWNTGAFDGANNISRFFDDHDAAAGWESSAGTLDNLRIFGAALAAQETSVGAMDGNNRVVSSAISMQEISVLADPTAVPEPTSMALLASALLGFGLIRRRYA